jgi:SAM-dependent methyltransferase
MMGDPCQEQPREESVMSQSPHHATERFTGLAQLYAKCRPSYPDAAIDYLVERCRLVPGAAVIDLGCGTGISTRLLARRGLRVTGVEPNADMRRQAEAESLPPDVPAPRYVAGQAEATGLPDDCAEVVLAAQAFHWFVADRALREAHRLLKPGGWMAVLGYERDETDPCSAAFGAVMRMGPDALGIETMRARAADALFAHPLFTEVERRTFAEEQGMDEDGLLGRAFSASYKPKEPALLEKFGEGMREVFARFQQGGRVTMRYETAVVTGRRVPG